MEDVTKHVLLVNGSERVVDETKNLFKKKYPNGFKVHIKEFVDDAKHFLRLHADTPPKIVIIGFKDGKRIETESFINSFKDQAKRPILIVVSKTKLFLANTKEQGFAQCISENDFEDLLKAQADLCTM